MRRFEESYKALIFDRNGDRDLQSQLGHRAIRKGYTASLSRCCRGEGQTLEARKRCNLSRA